MSHRVLNNTNLKASEIRDALAAGGGIVSNDTLSFFKPDANINIWSKFKPVTVTDGPDFVQAFDPGREYHDPYWWKSVDGDCGIDTQNTVAASINVFLDNVRNGNYYWTYKLPGKPFRLTDFCSYDIDAHCPVDGTLADNYWLQAQDPTGRLTFTFDLTTDLPDTNLTLSDIQVTTKNGGLTNLTDYYLGVLFWKEVGGVVTSRYYPTSTVKLGTDTVTVELEGLTGNAYWGEFNAIPYLSSAIQTLEGDEQEATYLTLNTAPKKIYIHGPGELIISIAMGSFINDKEVQYEIYCTNQGSSTVKNVTCQIWLARTKEESDAPDGSEGVVEGSVKEFVIDEIPAYTKELHFYSENWQDENIPAAFKIAPSLSTIDAKDEETYTYWIASRIEGYATTWYNLDDAQPEEE